MHGLRWGGGGTFPGLLSPKSYVDVAARPQKSDLFFTNFLPNFLPISIPFLKEKSAPKGRHIVYVYHVNIRTPGLLCTT